MNTRHPGQLALDLGCVSYPWLASAQSTDTAPYRWHGHMMGDGWGLWWGGPSLSALQILNERLARGEIERQDYEEKKRPCWRQDAKYRGFAAELRRAACAA